MARTYELTKIRTDGARIVTISKKQPELSVLQEAVGGYIERVEVQWQGKKWCNMWVNEEGLLQRLPYNSVATAIASLYARYPSDYYIVGDVIIVRSIPNGQAP